MGDKSSYSWYAAAVVLIAAGIVAGGIWTLSTREQMNSGNNGSPASGVAVEEPSDQGGERLELVLVVDRQLLQVKLGQTILRSYPFELTSEDSSDLLGVAVADTLRYAVKKVSLLSAARVIPEPTLQIISEETGLEPEILQRYLPGRMIIELENDLVLRVESNASGIEPRLWPTVQEELRRARAVVSGANTISLRVDSSDAMSIYGVCLSKPDVRIEQP